VVLMAEAIYFFLKKEINKNKMVNVSILAFFSMMHHHLPCVICCYYIDWNNDTHPNDCHYIKHFTDHSKESNK
jgi:hypothetical protein